MTGPRDCGGREQVHVKLNMSRCDLGGLEMRRKAVEQEPG